MEEGLFIANQLKFGRIVDNNFIQMGIFDDCQLHGPGKQILPNNMMMEGYFRDGRTLEDENEI